MEHRTMPLATATARRAALGAAWLLMGFSFAIAQALLARELLVSFAGHEISLGFILGSWLLLEALGSALLGRRVARAGGGVASYACLQVGLALMLLPVLGAALTVRAWLGVLPGQGLGLGPMALISGTLLLPLGLVDGAMFTVGCRVQATQGADPLAGVRRVYVYEALGGIAGGLLFTGLLISHLHAVQIALLVAVLNLASALFLLLAWPNRGGVRRAWGGRRCAAWPVGLALTLGVSLLATPAADRVQRRLMAQQWPGFELAFYGHSPYGSVVAIRQGAQLTYFASGLPVLSVPVPDVVQVEELVHLPLLFVPQPRRVLILGGGLGGILREALKYPLERVDYAELDPLLIEAVARLPTPLTQAELSDPRVRLLRADGRLAVHRLQATSPPPRYDLVLVNLAYPTTLQLNRFYTVEFWGRVRSLLADGGCVAFAVPGSRAYLSPALRDLHATLHRTLGQVFAHTRPIPDDVTLWLASTAPLESDAERLVARWQAHAPPSGLMTPQHIHYKLDARARAWFQQALHTAPVADVNQDLRPVGLLSGLAYWHEVFSPGLTPLFGLLKRLSLPRLALPTGLLLALGVGAARWRRRSGRGRLAVVIAITGLGGMAADLLILFALQVFYGYVYQLVGLLLAAFMAGLSLGGWLLARPAPAETQRSGVRTLRLVAGLVLAFWLVMPAALLGLHWGAGQGLPPLVVELALFMLNALAGALVGAQFAAANRLALRLWPRQPHAAGLLYGADLAGACVAAVLVAVVLLPALGLVQTCLFIALLAAGSLLLTLTLSVGAA